jgi:quercetin dioxygenase-like cupin family protein
MTINRSAARPTKRSPPEHFTGLVFSDPIVVGTPPSRMRASIVSFTPGARTAWHSHALGQTLYVVSGIGRIQIEGEPVEEIGPGDTVVIPPGARHWHGAAPNRMFSHLAMSERNEGGESDWFEQVSDEDYARTPATRV